MHLGELKAKPVEELLTIAEGMGIETVSYTHLTLPTICSV